MTTEDDHAALRTDASAGPVVVLVPGLGLDARSWRLVREELVTAALVVTLPALGSPAARGADLQVERQAGRLLEALPLDRDVVLVGHSAGCPVVVEAAARTSGVVGVVLVGPVTDPRARTWPRMLAGWGATARNEPPWQLPVLAPQYHATGAGSMVRGMDQMRRYRTRVGLDALSVPVRVIRGEHDRIAAQDWCDRLARTGGGDVVSVPAAAHMVPITHPHVVAAVVEDLLARVARKSAG